VRGLEGCGTGTSTLRACSERSSTPVAEGADCWTGVARGPTALPSATRCACCGHATRLRGAAPVQGEAPGLAAGARVGDGAGSVVGASRWRAVEGATVLRADSARRGAVVGRSDFQRTVGAPEASGTRTASAPIGGDSRSGPTKVSRAANAGASRRAAGPRPGGAVRVCCRGAVPGTGPTRKSNPRSIRAGRAIEPRRGAAGAPPGEGATVRACGGGRSLRAEALSAFASTQTAVGADNGAPEGRVTRPGRDGAVVAVLTGPSRHDTTRCAGRSTLRTEPRPRTGASGAASTGGGRPVRTTWVVGVGARGAGEVARADCAAGRATLREPGRCGAAARTSGRSFARTVRGRSALGVGAAPCRGSREVEVTARLVTGRRCAVGATVGWGWAGCGAPTGISSQVAEVGGRLGRMRAASEEAHRSGGDEVSGATARSPTRSAVPRLRGARSGLGRSGGTGRRTCGGVAGAAACLGTSAGAGAEAAGLTQRGVANATGASRRSVDVQRRAGRIASRREGAPGARSRKVGVTTSAGLPGERRGTAGTGADAAGAGRRGSVRAGSGRRSGEPGRHALGAGGLTVAGRGPAAVRPGTGASAACSGRRGRGRATAGRWAIDSRGASGADEVDGARTFFRRQGRSAWGAARGPAWGAGAGRVVDRSSPAVRARWGGRAGVPEGGRLGAASRRAGGSRSAGVEGGLSRRAAAGVERALGGARRSPGGAIGADGGAASVGTGVRTRVTSIRCGLTGRACGREGATPGAADRHRGAGVQERSAGSWTARRGACRAGATVAGRGGGRRSSRSGAAAGGAETAGRTGAARACLRQVGLGLPGCATFACRSAVRRAGAGGSAGVNPGPGRRRAAARIGGAFPTAVGPGSSGREDDGTVPGRTGRGRTVEGAVSALVRGLDGVHRTGPGARTARPRGRAEGPVAGSGAGAEPDGRRAAGRAVGRPGAAARAGSGCGEAGAEADSTGRTTASEATSAPEGARRTRPTHAVGASGASPPHPEAPAASGAAARARHWWTFAARTRWTAGA
jgi:hypothetical protein